MVYTLLHVHTIVSATGKAVPMLPTVQVWRDQCH